jgi:hypothetical protein
MGIDDINERKFYEKEAIRNYDGKVIERKRKKYKINMFIPLEI